MYIRKTVDEYEIRGLYNNIWEICTCENNFKEAKKRLKEYKENGDTCYKIVKKRIKKEE
jgi:hypothetical protein